MLLGETRFKEILEQQPPVNAKDTRRDKNDILIELLNTVRGFDKRLQRIEGNNTINNVVMGTATAETKGATSGAAGSLIRDMFEKEYTKDEVYSLVEEKFSNFVSKERIKWLINTI